MPFAVLGPASIVESKAVEYTATTTPADFGNLSKLQPEDFARLDRWLGEQVERGAYPSVSIAMATDKEIVHSSAFGWANRDKNRRATTETLYQWSHFWDRYENEHGVDREEAICRLRKLLGEDFREQPVCDLYLRHHLPQP